MKFKIITDSTANLQTDFCKQHDVSVVTLYYLINGEAHPAYKTDEPQLLKSFYQTIKDKPKLSTSCANQEQYYDEFVKSAREGISVLYIGFSSGVSASFSTAVMAKEAVLGEYPNAQIFCADTLTGSYGQGYFVEQAVRMRNEGKDVGEVFDYIINERRRLKTYVTVDDLYYLHQGGRIPTILYKLGSLIKIKPIIKVNEEGSLTSVGKVISRKQSLNHLVGVIKDEIDDAESSTVYIAHADCEEDAILLADKIKEFGVKEVKVGLLEAVIGSHTGIGGVAVFFLSKQ